jgi:hypothetical protein
MITIKIKTGNAAFSEDCGGSLEYETARILRELANKIESGSRPETARDINGNKVAEITYTGSSK